MPCSITSAGATAACHTLGGDWVHQLCIGRRSIWWAHLVWGVHGNGHLLSFLTLYVHVPHRWNTPLEDDEAAAEEHRAKWAQPGVEEPPPPTRKRMTRDEDEEELEEEVAARVAALRKGLMTGK